MKRDKVYIIVSLIQSIVFGLMFGGVTLEGIFSSSDGIGIGEMIYCIVGITCVIGEIYCVCTLIKTLSRKSDILYGVGTVIASLMSMAFIVGLQLMAWLGYGEVSITGFTVIAIVLITYHYIEYKMSLTKLYPAMLSYIGGYNNYMTNKANTKEDVNATENKIDEKRDDIKNSNEDSIQGTEAQEVMKQCFEED